MCLIRCLRTNTMCQHCAVQVVLELKLNSSVSLHGYMPTWLNRCFSISSRQKSTRTFPDYVEKWKKEKKSLIVKWNWESLVRCPICPIHTPAWAISRLSYGANVRKDDSFAATQAGIQTLLVAVWRCEWQALPKCLQGPMAVALEVPLVTSKSLICSFSATAASCVPYSLWMLWQLVSWKLLLIHDYSPNVLSGLNLLPAIYLCGQPTRLW